MSGNLLPEQFSDYSVFAFLGEDRMFTELTGRDFRQSWEQFLAGLRQENKEFKVAVDLSVLPKKFLESQELARQLYTIGLDGRKNQNNKVDLLLIGSEFAKRMSGLYDGNSLVVDFEGQPKVGY